MIGVVRSELTKITSLPSVLIATAVLLLLAVVVLLQPLGMLSDSLADMRPDGTIEFFTGHRQRAESLVLGLLVASSLQPGLFLPIIGAIIAGQEFRSGHLGVSVSVVPRRGKLVAGKVIATALYALAVGVILAALSTFFMYLGVRDWNPGILWSAEALAGQGRFLLYAVTATLIGFAVTLVARRTLVGIIAVTAFIALTMAQVFAAVPAIDALLPLSAARNLLLEPTTNVLSASPLHGAAVLTGWATVAVTGAAVAIRLRDAR
ncbi:ABC transporter permease [Nocardiopsis suaedae]|uniref:ABC transporter permease n=1 Tax=Nocardiopsis suaedae TaxID=3018444 RepID=A0ABT4TGD6_9ACTN|nr:ABC transporter permease [Nocardiopsis suaedae]MDA2803391.1 ABC transporter permease [Nocardiopsis suaedae]